jgi:hypothetical protein
VRLARVTAPATTVLLKSTGITGAATSPNLSIAWSTTDWSGLEASTNGTKYVGVVYARRTADSYDMAANISLTLKAAPGTSAVSPSSYPITVTAASVTLADTGGYFTATDVEGALAEGVPAWGVPLPVANGTDDTTAIQAILTAHAGKVICGRAGSSYKITDTLVISSGTVLDMTDCTITQVSASNAKTMLKNSAYAGSGARDTDITVIGGTWVRGSVASASNANTMVIVFHRCDRLKVRDLRITSGTGKYALWVTDSTTFEVKNINLASFSDGVHVSGPASGGFISGITGTTGDDMVALTARDYSLYELTSGGGNLSNITIRDVVASGCFEAVKVLGGDAVTVRGIAVEDIYGTATQHVVFIAADSANAYTDSGDIDGITVTNVQAGSATQGYACVAIGGTGLTVGTMDCTNIVSTNADTMPVAVMAGPTITTLRCSNITTQSAVNYRVIRLDATATVTNLIIDKLRAVLAASKRGIELNGTVGRVMISNSVITGAKSGDYAIYVATGVTTSISMNNVYVNTVDYMLWNQGTVTLTLDAVELTNCTVIAYGGIAAAITTILGSGGTITATSRITDGAAGCQVLMKSFNIPGDVLRAEVIAGQAKGQMVYNTNTSADAGAGPALFDGTYWTNAEQPVGPDVLVPPASVMQAPGSSVWFGANGTLGNRFHVPSRKAYRYINWYCTTQSGNVQLSIVKLNDASLNYTRVMNSGIIACPAAGAVVTDLGSTVLQPGDYALCFWADNIVVSLGHANPGVGNAGKMSVTFGSLVGAIPASGTASYTNRILLNFSLSAIA